MPIIDDDSAALSSVAVLTTTCDFGVRSYDSGDAFLAAYEATILACLLPDVRLTGMSGLELNSTLKAKGIGVLVILISGSAGTGGAEDAIKNRGVAFLENPIQPGFCWRRFERRFRHNSKCRESFHREASAGSRESSRISPAFRLNCLKMNIRIVDARLSWSTGAASNEPSNLSPHLSHDLWVFAG